MRYMYSENTLYLVLLFLTFLLLGITVDTCIFTFLLRGLSITADIWRTKPKKLKKKKKEF